MNVRWACLFLLPPLWSLMLGCAGDRRKSEAPPSIPLEQIGSAPKRENAVLRQFEERRDRADFEAAAARWRQSDPAGCRDRLVRLLARNPEHREAKALLAQVTAAEANQAVARKPVAPTDRAATASYLAAASASSAPGEVAPSAERRVFGESRGPDRIAAPAVAPSTDLGSEPRWKLPSAEPWAP